VVRIGRVVTAQTSDVGASSTNGTIIARFDAKTGVLDDSFGTGGIVTITGGDPLALSPESGRIRVASLDATGAQMLALFP
jgi:hypothetical protein